MKRLIALGVAGCLGLASNAVPAETLRPYENYSVHLGGVDGSVYAETTSAGQRLVATLAGAPGSTPVRFVAELAAGRSATVSVPRGPGETALEVTFTSQGDRLLVTDDTMLVGSIR